MARERSPKLPADPEHASNHQTKADSATTDKHPPVTTQSPPANAVAGTVDPPTAQPSRGELGRPLIAPANQEEDEDWFADILQLIIEMHVHDNQLRRGSSVVRGEKRAVVRDKMRPTDPPAILEQPEPEQAEMTSVDTAMEPVEAAHDETLMLRKFVSSAESVFHARQEDWIDAISRGLTDVVLCDQQGRYIEPKTEGERVKMKLRVSSASTYEQTLVPAQTAESPKPKPRRIGR